MNSISPAHTLYTCIMNILYLLLLGLSETPSQEDWLIQVTVWLVLRQSIIKHYRNILPKQCLVPNQNKG